MKSLVKWQVISFISRISAMLLGMVQSFVIIRILSVEEWGIVQLAVSIGGALGIYQHLGLASASTREISAAKKKEDIFQIFVTSAFVRYCVTLPLALGLFFFAGRIGNNVYNNPQLVLPLKVYAVTLLFQGIQSILNSVISGTKRFKTLFIYQVAIAVVSVLIYIPLVVLFKINGFFYALLAFNFISTIVLTYIAFKPLNIKFAMPNKEDFTRLLKEIFSISIAIYLVKIIYTNWEKFGGNVLGIFSTAEVVAIYSFAMLYAKKLVNISDSVTSVNLPVLSEEFTTNKDSFKSLFLNNFNKVFVLIVFSGAFASFWAPNLIRILVGGDKYAASYSLIPPMILAFMFYSFINILNSSILIPAKLPRKMVYSFIFLLIGTAGFYFAFRSVIPGISAMAWGMAFGSLLSFGYMTRSIIKTLNFSFLNHDHILLLFQGFVISLLCNVDVLWIKLASFIPFLGLSIWGVLITGFIKKSDLSIIFNRLKKVFAK